MQRKAVPQGRFGVRDEGAGDGTRTHDILLGKQTLYQLSYTRISQNECTTTPATLPDPGDSQTCGKRLTTTAERPYTHPRLTGA